MDTMLQYKCPCCSGSLNFDSGVQKMKCPYCDTEFEVETLKHMDEAMNRESDMTWQSQAGSQWQEGEGKNLRTYVCQSCGGEIVGDATTAATTCPYCDNPVVMSGQFAGDLRPDLVIPFQLSKEQAQDALKTHLSGKLLLPKVFKEQNRIERIQGVYVPFWLYDTDVQADITYRATRTRTWSDSRNFYTETQHFRLRRGGSLAFSAVPVDGSSKMADELMESIEPYDPTVAEEFQTAYLAGYLADKYDVDSETSAIRANERIRESTADEFAATVHGYSGVTADNVAIRLENSKARYALYPVWMLTTKYKNEKYTFAMNGQTGKFVGNLPVNWGLFWLLLVGIALGVGLLLTAISEELVGSMIVGVVVGLVVTLFLKSQLKTVKFQRHAGSYILPGSMQLTISQDIFLYKNVTKVPRNQK